MLPISGSTAIPAHLLFTTVRSLVVKQLRQEADNSAHRLVAAYAAEADRGNNETHSDNRRRVDHSQCSVPCNTHVV